MIQLDFNTPIHVYFSGIGGISMSGLARILKSRGFQVSGSDRAQSALTDALAADGIHVIIGQKKENITPDIDLVVFTAAIRPDNPEYIAVMENDIPHITRSVLLGQIMRGYKDPVAISGTHGKTTTTSMISEILMEAGTDPTLSIGGILDSIGGNVRIGNSSYFAAEACEYTNSFLDMFPGIGIILDIDEDHLDFFKDLADIRRSFRKFAQLIPEDGALIINAQIPDYNEITEGLSCDVILYGPDSSADYWPEDIRYNKLAYPTYTLCSRESDGSVKRQEISLSVPGEHNVFNSMAAVAAADRLGISRDDAAAALKKSARETALQSLMTTRIILQRSRRHSGLRPTIRTKNFTACSSPTLTQGPRHLWMISRRRSRWPITSSWPRSTRPERPTLSGSAPIHWPKRSKRWAIPACAWILSKKLKIIFCKIANRVIW